LQAAVRGLSSASVAPHRLCKRLNSLVYQNTASDRFITFFYAQLDGAARRLSYVNAGHNAPFLVRRDGAHERLREGGGVLGIFDSQNYEMGTALLQPGDRMLLFTDGVTEACNALDEEFGEARLLRLVQEHRTHGASSLQETILAAAKFGNGGQRTDDATLVVLAVCE
jgi:sigma-B regulation protein RsbU (phosphoserine phosphatase)